MPSQAFLTWLETYSSYEGDELDERIDELKSQVSIFSAQGIGSKNFVRDLGELRDQLSAAIRAKREKGQTSVGNSGTADYSGIRVS